MGKLVNVLLSLLVVSVLSGCNGSMPAKDIIYRAASLVLVPAPIDEALNCLSVDVFGVIITRDSELSNRVQTLEAQIDAHNSSNQ